MTDYDRIANARMMIQAICWQICANNWHISSCRPSLSWENFAEFESAAHVSALRNAADRPFVTGPGLFVTDTRHDGGIVLKQGDGIFGLGTGRTVMRSTG